MHWFKIHHGYNADTKLGLIAHKLKIPRAHINAIFLDMLEYASRQADRGSVAGYDTEAASHSLGLPESEFRDASLSLRDRHLVTGDRIANWEKYQSPVDHTHAERQRRYREKQKQHLNNEVTVSDSSRDIDKSRIEKKRKNPQTPKGDFTAFYSAYPKKVAQDAAAKAYASAIKKDTHENIMKGLAKYADSCRGTERKFIANPSTWLNQGRWKDEYGQSKAKDSIYSGVEY